MLPALTLVLISQDPAAIAHRIMTDFGYPSFRPDRSTRTESGGWRFVQGSTSLTVDAEGRPRWLAIEKVKFERSDAKAARAKIARLLAKYPLRLPEGKWVTERSLAPNPYGSAPSSMCYFFVPILKGYPFFNASEMTVQFSAGLDRVLEWAYHPWPVPAAALPAKIMSRVDALKSFDRLGRTAVAGHLDWSFHGLEPGTLQLAWLYPTHPRLAYSCNLRAIVIS